MIEIAFAACTLIEASGLPARTHCREFNIPLTLSAVTPYACMFAGQVEIAKWVNEHPNWTRIPGYQCRPAGMVAKV